MYTRIYVSENEVMLYVILGLIVLGAIGFYISKKFDK